MAVTGSEWLVHSLLYGTPSKEQPFLLRGGMEKRESGGMDGETGSEDGVMNATAR